MVEVWQIIIYMIYYTVFIFQLDLDIKRYFPNMLQTYSMASKPCQVETSAICHCNHAFQDWRKLKGNIFLYLRSSFKKQAKHNNENQTFAFSARVYNIFDKNTKRKVKTCRFFSTILSTYVPLIFLHQLNDLQNMFHFPDVERWKAHFTPALRNILFQVTSNILSGQYRNKFLHCTDMHNKSIDLKNWYINIAK